jgi:hypothetical protein
MQDVIASLQTTLDQHIVECTQWLVDKAEDHIALVDRIESICEETKSLRDDVKAFSGRMDVDLMILKRAISGMPMGGEAPSKLRVPELKPFTGARSAKELENFL